MDLLCPKCGEPIDPYEFHDIADDRGTTYTEISRAFRAGGCRAIGYRCNTTTANPEIATVYDLLGDDTDGAAAELSDIPPYADAPTYGILARRAAELAQETAR